METPDCDPLQQALRYATTLAWHVFPVVPAPGKRPLTQHGFHEATTDPEVIKRWWTEHPNAQIGVACGASGLVFLDVDIKKGAGGDASLEVLEIEHGAHGGGLVMSTPSGGLQVAFRDAEHRCRRRQSVRPGIDVLGDGGYTIVPSPASPGREWIEGDPFDGDDLVEPPQWLVDLAPARKVEDHEDTAAEAEGTGSLCEAEVADIEAALAYIDPDDRDTWIRVGMTLKSTCAGEQAYELWATWSKRSPKWDARVARKQWNSLEPHRSDGPSINIETLFWMAKQNGYQGPPDGQWSDVDISPLVRRLNDRKQRGKERKGGVYRRLWAPIPEGDLSREPAPRAFVVRYPKMLGAGGDGFLPAGVAVNLSGAGGTHKTRLLVQLAVCIITGRPWVGFVIDPEFVGRSVLLLLGEDSYDDAHRRLYYICQHYSLTADEKALVEQRLVMLPLMGADGPTSLLTQVRSGNGAPSAAMTELLELVREKGEQHPWGLIGLDTFSRLFSKAESDNDLATVATQLCERLACVPGGPAVVSLHHSSKESRRIGEVDARGVTAITDAPRLALTLKRCGADGERIELGLTKTNHTSQLRSRIVLEPADECRALRRVGADELHDEKQEQVAAQVAEVQRIAELAEEVLRGDRAKTRDDIAQMLVMRKQDARPGIGRAISQGLIVHVREDNGMWYRSAQDVAQESGDSSEDAEADAALAEARKVRELVPKVVAALAEHPANTKGVIEGRVTGKAVRVRKAIDIALSEGLIIRVREGSASWYRCAPDQANAEEGEAEPSAGAVAVPGECPGVASGHAVGEADE